MNEQIEDRLRSALRSEAEGVRLSSDPWQQNQRRVSAAASGRSRRVLGVAAAMLVVATLVGASALLSGRGSDGMPAGGSGDPFGSGALLGPPVEAETLTFDGALTTHTIALSDMTGKGPNLCEKYETITADRGSGDSSSGSSSGGGGCTPRDPDADDAGVAFDWLMGTEGGGDIRGVTAGVDSRASKVEIWMDNGDLVLATLHPTGWDDTRMLALTTQPPNAPTAQRLVAYGRDGNVLQALDLRARLGENWLRPSSVCDILEIGLSLPGADIGASATEARIELDDASGGVRRVCLPLDGAIQGTTDGGDIIVVLAPEVAGVRLGSGDAAVEVPTSRIVGTAWNAALLRGAGGLEGNEEIVAYDESGQALESQLVIGLL